MHSALSRRALLRGAAAVLTLAPAAGAAPEPCLDRLLRRRRMVRRFGPEPVPDATVRRLVSAALRAPSAGHTQPWSFVVVRDRARREALARAAHEQMFVADAPLTIVACADLSRSRARYGTRGDRYGLVATAFASLCLLLAAVEEGLGACFVGAFRDAEVRTLLGLPDHVQPLAIIPIGHPRESPSAQRLRAPGEVMHEERWAEGGLR